MNKISAEFNFKVKREKNEDRILQRKINCIKISEKLNIN